ncbi:MAG: adenylate/guanylate cyclase domain-containing protein [Bacteroidales bacterium]
MRNIIYILFLILFPFSGVFSQTIELGVPFYENISPKEIGYGGDNFTITQNMNGTMYFGNFNGILSYNNLSWDLKNFNGKPILYRDKVGHIYIGGYNKIQEISLDNNGNTHYKNLVNSSSAYFGQISSIETFRNRLFFIANDTLYKISKKTVVPIHSDSIHLKIFTERDALFVSTSKNLYKYDFDKLILTQYNDFFRDKPVYDIFRFTNCIIFRTQHAFYSASHDNQIEKFTTEIDSDLSLFGYNCSERLSNNTLAIGTKNNGLYFVDKNGNLINYLNVQTGLFDNTVHDLFVDESDNLWAGFSNGIARIEVPSAFTYFTARQNIHGSVHSIVRHNGFMYFGTQKGIFKLTRTGTNHETFQTIFPEHVSCNTLISYKQTLFAGTNKGLYAISESETQKISDSPISAACISLDSSSIIYTDNNHIYTVSISETEQYLQKTNTYGPVNGEIQSISQDKNGTIWIGTYYNGIYKISDNRLQKSHERGLPENIEWIEVFHTSQGTLFSSTEGLYKYDSNIDVFYADNTIPRPTIHKNSRVRCVVEDENKNIWLTFASEGLYKNKIAVAWHTPGLNRYTLITSQFNKLSYFICNTIFPDKNSVVWYGGFDGLVRLDFKQLSNKKQPLDTYIHNITIGKDSILHNYKKSGGTKNVQIPYTHNSIRFDFASPIYENHNEVTYKYRLKGFQKNWSRKTSANYKEFSNLPAGKYTFEVHAVDANGNNAKIATFHFKVTQHPLLRWWAIIFYIIILSSIVALILRWRAYQFVKEKSRLSNIIKERTEELLIEKEKTEVLLSNILPEETAKELKEKGRASSMRFNMSTILFSDIHGFTKIAEEMTPDILINELDKFFLEFDKIVEKHNIEKIKTIGDAYMCAGGIPQKNTTNPIEVVVAALEMQYRIKKLQEESNLIGKDYWGLRIGIHTGPVIAGVVGSKKFSYDIWGDSVNTASRMESSGEVGKVNISESTYTLIQDFFDCEYRGKLPVKHKGEIDMYFVKGFKTKYTDDPLRIFPNDTFNFKFLLLKFEDLQEMMFERFEKELPKNLLYHNLKHTIDVVVQTEIIALEEHVSDEEMFLLKTAALFHDSGFLLGYEEHEEMGVQLCRNILPKYNYSEEQINKISNIILATRLPHKPHNHLEKIMCDADLDYLGRDDYFPVSRDLYRELIEQGIINKSEYEWNKMQIKFLQNHRFFTESSKRRRNENKNKQIQKLQEQTRSFSNIKNN